MKHVIKVPNLLELPSTRPLIAMTPNREFFGQSLIFTFKIDTGDDIKVYQAEHGMNWIEWVQSNYNIDKWYMSGIQVVDKTDSMIIANGSSTSKIERRTYGVVWK